MFCISIDFKLYATTFNLTLHIGPFSNAGCYAQKFGARGYGHMGFSSLGLMSDIRDNEWQR